MKMDKETLYDENIKIKQDVHKLLEENKIQKSDIKHLSVRIFN